MRRHQGVKKTDCGLTVVELLTVVAILSLLAAVALPLIFSSLPKYRLRAAARELAIDFKRARVEAAKRNRNVLIRFTPAVDAHGGGYDLCVDDNTNNVCDTGEEIARVTMPQDIRLSGPNFSNTNMCGYDPRGMPWRSRWGRVDIAVADGTRGHRINLSAHGAVRMAVIQ
jgi:prepilin-type N-terminal cleavage/methylation domain